MTINKVIFGDLIELAKENEFNVIIHGCNCQGKMGSGIAPLINNAFKDVLKADRMFEIPIGSPERLGNYSYAYDTRYKLVVVNAYTQFTFTGRSKGEIDVDYDAIRTVFTRLNRNVSTKAKVGIPLIGCGLAGGDWNMVESIINEVTPNLDITLVKFKESK